MHTLWIKFVPCSPIVVVMFHAHIEWPSSTSPLTSSSFSCPSCCLTPSTSLTSWITSPRTSAEELGPPGQKELLHRLRAQRPLHHGGLLSSTPRSLWPSNGSLKTSTTMTSPSVRRSLMRVEDEPITLKKKACRPVCRRRHWVMIERGNPLFAVTEVTSKVTKFKDNSESEQVGIFLDRQSEQIPAENTKSMLIMTEEVYRNWMKRSRRRKKNFIMLKQAIDVDKDYQLLHEQLLKQNLDLREAHEKSLTEKEVKEVSEFFLRHYCETKISRGSEHYFGTRPARKGIEERN